MARAAILLSVGLAALGCASTPPPRWATGGAPLVIAAASWRRADEVTVDLTARGQVFENGSEIFTIDRAGRVFDWDSEPIAILLPDGEVVGDDDIRYGKVGVANAAPPGSPTAWLSILPDGTVLHFDPDGERSTDGRFRGCEGAMLRTCTLVAHLITIRRTASASSGTVYVGLGIGVWR